MSRKNQTCRKCNKDQTFVCAVGFEGYMKKVCKICDEPIKCQSCSVWCTATYVNDQGIVCYDCGIEHIPQNYTFGDSE